MARFCAECGIALPGDAKFCPQCAHPVVPDAPPASAPVQSAPEPVWQPLPPATGGISGWNVSAEPPAQPAGRSGIQHPRLIGCLGIVAVLALLWMAISTASRTGSLGLPNLGSSTVVLTYKLGGTAKGANVTFTDGNGNIQQMNGKAVPLTRSNDGGDGLRISAKHGAYVSILAQNTGDSGTLTCSIDADGVTINTGRSDGAYAIVTCSGAVP